VGKGLPQRRRAAWVERGGDGRAGGSGTTACLVPWYQVRVDGGRWDTTHGILERGEASEFFADIDDLSGKGAHLFEVRAVNDAGYGPTASIEWTPSPWPLAPTGLLASYADGAIRLSWDKPNLAMAGSDAPHPTHYQVRTDGNKWVDVDGFKCELGGVDRWERHSFEVRAVNIAGPGPSASVEYPPKASNRFDYEMMRLAEEHGRTVIIKETVREVVKYPCPFCNCLMEITANACPQCGAPQRR